MVNSLKHKVETTTGYRPSDTSVSLIEQLVVILLLIKINILFLANTHRASEMNSRLCEHTYFSSSKSCTKISSLLQKLTCSYSFRWNPKMNKNPTYAKK